MTRREQIKTSKKDIVDYWFKIVYEGDLSIDALEAHERCWRCGCEAKLERCHITPHSLGGKDEPSNFVLLCKRCHIDNPNVPDPEIMWDWLKAYKVSFYDTFWTIQGMEEYKRVYKKSILEEIEERKIDDIEKLKKIFSNVFEKTSFHYGHPYLNVATLAGVHRMAFKEWDMNYQKDFDHATDIDFDDTVEAVNEIMVEIIE